MAELKIISMDEVQSKEVNWLWYPYIPYGKITIIQGDPGEGKTTLALRLAALLSKGEALPYDDTEREPVKIIYQTAEDGLEDTIKPEDFTVNEAQILAWTAALIAKPRILLVDEFDASIDDKILTTIDTLLEKEFTDSTIIMVSHKNRSALKFHKKIHMEESRIQVETC